MLAADIVDCAEALKEKGDLAGCVAAYKLWLRESKASGRHVAWFNLGVTLSTLGRGEEALDAYQKAVAMYPQFPEALLNLGFLWERRGEPQNALAQWRVLAGAQTTTAHRSAALNQIGRLSEILEVFDEAEEALGYSLQIRPKQTDALQHWLRVRQKRCSWPIYGELPGHSTCDMLLATSPIAMLGESDSPLNQLYAARAFGLRLYPVLEPALCEGLKYSHRRLRVGYLSSDFNIHAVGLLLAELFENHDLARIETFGFCVSKDDHTEHRERLIASLEHFERVGHLSDEQIARRILEQEIDVLVDLNGVSSNTRVGVLRFRPAPVQVTWLGYIGTTALPWIDYVIADRISLPEKLAEFFTEKPLYLPHSFLPFDSQREPCPPTTRESHGLPEGRFVFASFNNVTKMNPKMFGTWLRILSRVPNSILWLVDDNRWATANLKAVAARHGIGAERFVFAARCPYGVHLARVPHADLFLDNHPYNAGSTATDTLHMGVPMLTLAGETFVSRMGYGLLNDYGLTELVTFNHQEYEDRAVALAANPVELTGIRAKLLNSTQRRSRASSIQFARNLEALFLKAAGRESVGKPTTVIVRSLRDSPAPLSVCSEFQLLALSEKAELQVFSEALFTAGIPSLEKTERPNFPKVPARILSLIPSFAGETPDVVLNAVSPPVPYTGPGRRVFHLLSCDALGGNTGVPPSAFTEGKQAVITPSDWSKQNLVLAGMQPERIHVVPYGVDTSVFRPLTPEGRAQVRSQMGLAQDAFVLIHVGCLSRANGGDLLLRAFAELRGENPKLRLLLREDYSSEGGFVQRAIDSVNQSHPGLLTPEIIGALILLPSAVSLGYAQFFYGVSDLYVAPFRAAAFHLPALEAMSCGLNVLITGGGSADALMLPGVCFPIQAGPATDFEPGNPAAGKAVEPDYLAFVRQLRQAIKQRGQNTVGAVERQRFLEKWSWTRAADALAECVGAKGDSDSGLR
jgi:predicted O-linked N-acetylglucosamine transferase (SPINDLY family)/glycosyltransferase involved in cell wall biosynthesis